MPQIIKRVKDIPGLTPYEKQLLSAWRETYRQYVQYKSGKSKNRLREGLMMYVELIPMRMGSEMLRCHHISQHCIQGEPID